MTNVHPRSHNRLFLQVSRPYSLVGEYRMLTSMNRPITQAARPSVDSPAAPPLSDGTVADTDLLSYLRQLERLAFRDHLTELPNRCAIDFAISQQVSAFHRYGVPFSVLLADLDDFKWVNDRHGHPAGDRVLQFVAESLRKCIREADFPGRWGGEEFMVIAPFTDAWGLPALAERIRTQIAETHARFNHSVVRITASIGATACRQNDDAHSLIERVDVLLYKSKSCGKNRITCE